MNIAFPGPAPLFHPMVIPKGQPCSFTVVSARRMALRVKIDRSQTRALSFTVEAGPFAGLNESRPIERMAVILVLEHCELGLP